jgi:phosphoribosylformylglycinamidine (FGAM) synthase PurS component
VRVPRNVRDPEAYALRRARAMIGVDEPEHIQVHDYLKINERIQKQCPENIQQDIFVELHFNGFYED